MTNKVYYRKLPSPDPISRLILTEETSSQHEYSLDCILRTIIECTDYEAIKLKPEKFVTATKNKTAPGTSLYSQSGSFCWSLCEWKAYLVEFGRFW